MLSGKLYIIVKFQMLELRADLIFYGWKSFCVQYFIAGFFLCYILS